MGSAPHSLARWLLLPTLWGVGGPAHAQWTATRLHNSAFNGSGALAAAGDWQGGAFVAGQSKPILWHSSSNQWINLAPGIGDHGVVFGMHVQYQTGQFNGHAALWSGTPESRVDLNPAWAELSEARAVWGHEQVGVASTNEPNSGRASLWHGSSASYVNLHPAGAVRSEARAVAAGQQGGFVEYPHPMAGTIWHAALWSGTPESFVDLNPPGASQSVLYGMSPGQQVGAATLVGIGGHAGYWTGTPESFVDLHPAGAGMSSASGTVGSAQVGFATFAVGSAVIWFGSAESVVNLHDFLPAGQYDQSVASAVSLHNGLYYVAGTAWSAVGHNPEAWLWVGVPTPGSAFALVVSGAFAAARRRR